MVPQQYFIHDFAGSSEALKKVIESLRSIAPSKLNVLIQGESGTGKEVTVKAIHCNSGLAGHLVPAGSIGLTLQPIALYGAVFSLLLFAVLWFGLRGRKLPAGRLTGAYLAAWGAGQLFITPG